MSKPRLEVVADSPKLDSQTSLALVECVTEIASPVFERVQEELGCLAHRTHLKIHANPERNNDFEGISGYMHPLKTRQVHLCLEGDYVDGLTQGDTVLDGHVAEVLCHELSHASRYRHGIVPGFLRQRMLHAFIEEGFAHAYTSEVYPPTVDTRGELDTSIESDWFPDDTVEQLDQRTRDLLRGHGMKLLGITEGIDGLVNDNYEVRGAARYTVLCASENLGKSPSELVGMPAEKILAASGMVRILQHDNILAAGKTGIETIKAYLNYFSTSTAQTDK